MISVLPKFHFIYSYSLKERGVRASSWAGTEPPSSMANHLLGFSLLVSFRSPFCFRGGGDRTVASRLVTNSSLEDNFLSLLHVSKKLVFCALGFG